MVLVEAKRESDDEADSEAKGVDEIQSAKRASVFNARRLQSLLDVHVSDLGRQVFAGVVSANESNEYRTDEEASQNIAEARAVATELV